MHPLTLLVLVAALVLAACGGAPRGKADRRVAVTEPAERDRGERPGVQRGKGTWYGGKWHGRKTANGERYDKRSMTAAHRTLKFGTRVRVTNLKNGRSVILRINNRGPYGKGRIIDVSEIAAEKLDMIEAGVVPVTVEVVR